MVKNLPQRGFESGRNLRSDIQGLRGIAVLAVLVYHSGLALPGGFVGVDMFFVISGFVITASLLSEYANSGTISIKKFYQRRFERLFPALALVVVVTTILASFTLSPLGPQQLTASTALAALFSLANVSIALNSGDYFDPATQLNPLLHTWSLSVEEQFYIILPIAFLLASKFPRSFSKICATFFVLIISVSLSMAFFSISNISDNLADFFGFYSPIVRAWEFGIGGLIAWWSTHRKIELNGSQSRAAHAFGLTLIGFSIATFSSETLVPGPSMLLPVFGTALLIIAGFGNPWSKDILRNVVVGKIGDWSYSIYLWHWPMISITTVLWPSQAFPILGAIAFSLLLSVLSYYFVESTMRDGNPKKIPSTKFLVAGIIVVPILIASNIGPGERN